MQAGQSEVRWVRLSPDPDQSGCEELCSGALTTDRGLNTLTNEASLAMIDLFCYKVCHLGPVSPPGLHAEMVAVMTDLSLIVLIVANTNQGNAGSVQRMMRSVHSVNKCVYNV